MLQMKSTAAKVNIAATAIVIVGIDRATKPLCSLSSYGSGYCFMTKTREESDPNVPQRS